MYFYLSDSIVSILRLFISITLFLPYPAYTQGSHTKTESVNDAETRTAHIENTDSASPPEIGPGGNVKLERKYRTMSESHFDWHTHILWESRYVTEGRDNLSGKSIISASSEFTIDRFNIIPWIANSPDTHHSEFNLNIIYATKLAKDIKLYAGYSHIQLRDTGIDASDNEISLDLAFSRLKQFHMLASIYHSFENKGSFMELTVTQSYRIDKTVHFGVRGVLGVNAGYIPYVHNGFNHYQILANIAYRPLTQIEIYAYTGYNASINRDITRYAGDKLLGNYLWTGIGFIYLF